jgi:hypothetical protein
MAGPRLEPIVTSERLAEELDAIEERLAILQVSYEKYFVGIDRRPPDPERKAVSEKIRRLRTSQTKNTALRFRIQTIFTRLLTYERLWDRTLREMEEGTYRRDVFKARIRGQQRLGKQEPAAAPNGAQPPPPPPDDGPLIAPPSLPPPPPRASQPPPPPAHISDENLRRLYHTYLRARQQCGESVEGLSYDSVASKIRQQVPQLMQKHNARSVDFKVVIKGGKAILKAVPKV